MINVENMTKILIQKESYNGGVGISSQILANRLLTFNAWKESALELVNKQDNIIGELLEKKDNDLAIEKAVERLETFTASYEVYRELFDFYNEYVYKTINETCASSTDIERMKKEMQQRTSKGVPIDRKELKKKIEEQTKRLA